MSESPVVRQQVLYLWASGSALDSTVVGWAFHDGTEGQGTQLPPTDPPYDTGERALHDGWMLLQSAQLIAPRDTDVHRNGYLDYEFVFERRVAI